MLKTSVYIKEMMAPVYDFLFHSFPVIGAFLLAILLIFLAGKLIDAITFRKHKNDVHSTTNTWWSWEEYENEKKNKNRKE